MGQAVASGTSGCCLSSAEHARLAARVPPGRHPLDLAGHHGITVRFAALPVPHVIPRRDLVLVALDGDPGEAALVAIACSLLDSHGGRWTRGDARALTEILRARTHRPRFLSRAH